MSAESFPGVEITRGTDCKNCDLDEVVGMLTAPLDEGDNVARISCVNIHCRGMASDEGGHDMCDFDVRISTYDKNGTFIGSAQTEYEKGTEIL